MHITRFEQALRYDAPHHVDMRCLRLQGKEAGPSQQMWLGMSQILPGGHTGLDSSPMEKIYLVLEGQLHLITEHDGQPQEQVLGPFDSCCIAPNETRQLINRSQRPVLVALTMANMAATPSTSS